MGGCVTCDANCSGNVNVIPIFVFSIIDKVEQK